MSTAGQQIELAAETLRIRRPEFDLTYNEVWIKNERNELSQREVNVQPRSERRRTWPATGHSSRDGGGLLVEDDGRAFHSTSARVFEPSHRVRARSAGTGLGLNLVHEVVARHRGRAAILDAPGDGAVVRIDLPPC
jgi:nitrogen fixation/metabolism regulation signal transduction histidine kinase